MNEQTWQITEKESGDRIDKIIPSLHGEWSRSYVQALLKEARVKVNGQTVKSNYKVRTGDKITVFPKELEEPDTIVPDDIPLDILYEDKDVIVVNKKRGMVVHPAPGHERGTLVNALLFHCEDLSGINGEKRPGIVHRIDKDTSGVLVAAKNDVAHEKLSEQLRNKTVERVYQAIVHGVIPHDHGTVDAPIGRDPKDRQKMTVTDKNAKEAITHFSVLERFQNHTLVECKLETGRTHQIRVHMNYIEHSLVGDPKYTRAKTAGIQGQALHAAKLGFDHPRTGEYLEFKASLPEDMSLLLEELRKNA